MATRKTRPPPRSGEGPRELPLHGKGKRESRRKQAQTTPIAERDFPIVGIGASAGGLAAFEAFFSGMPSDVDPDIAFVLVQHLAPDHKSSLTHILQSYTRLQVFEVEDGMDVRPNCAYIIPPGRDMALLGGTLQLLEPSAPRGQRMPIDFFFRSLAQDQRERAVAVVLSGTGSDGTLGARAIKGEGGMVMVQTPESAAFDGMPRSAVATGLADYQLPPADMPRQIISYVRHATSTRTGSRVVKGSQSESALNKLYVLLRAATGHDFSQYKPSSVSRRVERRMAIHQIDTIEAYVVYLQKAPEEVEALFRDLLIGVTSFFRDPEAFAALEENAVPELFAGKEPDSDIRVWSAGCSTGEEAYSIAILLAEHQERLKHHFRIQIFATDIDGQSIATARAGLFSASISSDITPERLKRFFSLEPDGSSFRIRKDIRDMLIFSEQNLIKDSPFSRLDLVVCRNLLIYVEPELQKKIIPLFHYALRPNGFLFLGSSETVGDSDDLFATVDRKHKLYRSRESYREKEVGRFPPLARRRGPLHGRSPSTTSRADSPSLQVLTEQALLQHLAPVAALVDKKGDILYLHGRSGTYLEPAPGEPGPSNILLMAREGLRNDLAIALRKAAASDTPVRCKRLSVQTHGDVAVFNLTVRPVSAPAQKAPDVPHFLVIIEPVEAVDHELDKAKGSRKRSSTRQTASDIEELRQELRAKEEYLHATIEELQTSNEELRAANEEMQSINEELQSTNEELETSKEELQSVNEELATVNAELQTNVSDLSRANNDMNNLLAGTGIATVFVDHALRIMRFTPSSTKIINLIQSDVGRPVGHIVSNLRGYDTLLEDIQEVLDTLVPRKLEVQATDGIEYSMNIMPYRTVDNVIEGAVLTFVDISAMKRAQAALGKAHIRMTNALAATVREPLLVLDSDLRLLSANRAFYDTFEATPDRIAGQSLFEIDGRRWDTPELRATLAEALSSDSPLNDVLVRPNLGASGRRSFRMNSCRLVDDGTTSAVLLLTIEVLPADSQEDLSNGK